MSYNNKHKKIQYHVYIHIACIYICVCVLMRDLLTHIAGFERKTTIQFHSSGLSRPCLRLFARIFWPNLLVRQNMVLAYSMYMHKCHGTCW